MRTFAAYCPILYPGQNARCPLMTPKMAILQGFRQRRPRPLIHRPPTGRSTWRSCSARSVRRCAARARIREPDGATRTIVDAARAEAERLWPVSADRSLRLRPGVRGGIGTPVKAVLRKLMRWYVEPLAYDQRSFNAATLRLVDDLQAQVDRLQAELREARGTTERT